MTPEDTTGRDRLAKRRRYRRLLFGSLGAGVALGLLLRVPLGYPLAGEAVYWLGIAGFLAAWRLSPVALFDERDRSLERRASHATLTVAGVVLVVGASLARVGPRVDAFEVPAAAWGALYAYVALFAVFGVVYGWLRYRP